MGNTYPPPHHMCAFTVESQKSGCKIVHLKQHPKLKYCIKSIVSTSSEEHADRIAYFAEYCLLSKDTDQLVRLIKVFEQPLQSLCSSVYYTHLLYEYSPLTLEKEVRERRKLGETENGSRHFGYRDLCSIAYGCLSALWFANNTSEDSRSGQLHKFRTIFISLDRVMILGDGIVKIADQHLMGYEDRYIYNPKVVYSPQKMIDFQMTDDCQCAVFELGMTLLSTALLADVSDVYNGYHLKKDHLARLLLQAKHIYAMDIVDDLNWHLFELVCQMTQPHLTDRFTLQQAVAFAEQMYQFKNMQQCSQAYVDKHPKQSLPSETHIHHSPVVKKTRKEMQRNKENEQERKEPKTLSTTEDEKVYISHRIQHCENINEDSQRKLKPWQATKSTKNRSGMSRFRSFKGSLQRDSSQEVGDHECLDPLVSSFNINSGLHPWDPLGDCTEHTNILSPYFLQSGLFEKTHTDTRESYSYKLPQQKLGWPVEDTPVQGEEIYTDPKLLATISRQLQLLENKRGKFIPEGKSNRCWQQRTTVERFQPLEDQSRWQMDISNQVYLHD